MKKYRLSTMSVWFTFLILVVMAFPVVSAGTLVSGGQLEIESNIDGIDGLTIQGEYSTTPYSSDTVFITRNNVESKTPSGENVDLTRDIRIDFSNPEYSEKFLVGQQTPLTRLETFEYNVGFWGSKNQANLEYCLNQGIQEARSQASTIEPSFIAQIQGVGYLSCDVIGIVESKREGFVAGLQRDQVEFDQNITLDDVGTVRLYNKDGDRQTTDRINGEARVVLTNLNDLLSSRLSTQGVYAYSNKRNNAGGDWQPFSDSGNVDRYTSHLQSRVQSTTQYETPSGIGGIGIGIVDDNKDVMRDVVNEHNQNVDSVLSQTGNTPSQWVSRADMNGVTSTANTVTVPYRDGQDSISHRVLLQLRGESFGLQITGGTPVIKGIQETVSWQENSNPTLVYQISNEGSGTGSFTATVSCNNNNVQGLPSTYTLGSGETVNEQIRLTSRPESLSGQTTTSCELKVEDSDSQETSTRSFTATVESKDSCSQGEQTVSTNNQGQQVLTTLNSDCDVINTEICEGEWNNRLTGWSCEKSSVEQGEQGEGNDEDFTTQIVVTVISLFVAGLSGFITNTYLTSWTRFTQYRIRGVDVVKRGRQIIVLVVVIGTFFLIPELLSSLFTFWTDYFNPFNILL